MHFFICSLYVDFNFRLMWEKMATNTYDFINESGDVDTFTPGFNVSLKVKIWRKIIS